MSGNIDVRGLSCPEPVIRTKQALDQGLTNITVLADSRVSAENIRRLVKNYDCSCTVDDQNGEFTITINKEGK
ncbi:MAG: sulfurtransferase TusA family protein [Clostridiales bacterium]|jgi:TusA-related sulfurtransferase|nr:sulfurtransferase TusA family protein [Clostridiales bacterium]